MKRKAFLAAIALTMALIGSIDISAETPKSELTEIGISKKETGVKHRPKAPSRQHIYCAYGAGTLSFQFTYPEGVCQLRVTDLGTGQTHQYTFDSTTETSVYTGHLTRAYIEISTASGHEYEGHLYS